MRGRGLLDGGSLLRLGVHGSGASLEHLLQLAPVDHEAAVVKKALALLLARMASLLLKLCTMSADQGLLVQRTLCHTASSSASF